MGKKDKNKKKGKGAEKTAMKTDKKLLAKQKKLLEKIGEVRICRFLSSKSLKIWFISLRSGWYRGHRRKSRSKWAKKNDSIGNSGGTTISKE